MSFQEAYDHIDFSMHPYSLYQMNAAVLYPYSLYAPYGLMGHYDYSRKRGREFEGEFRMEYEDFGGFSSKRRAFGHGVVFRMIVPSKLVGRVIGKEGSRIRQIREETGANIKIADSIVLNEERVIVISSPSDEGKTSNAENALTYIAKSVLKDSEDNEEQVGLNMIRLFIASSQIECLIGKSGQNFEKIRKFSGAKVSVLAPNQPPLCASAHESDHIVQISGDVPEILTALEQIGRILRENPSTEFISFASGYHHPSISLNSQVPSGEYMTSEITITENFVGGLIGKNGYNISRIRNASGATVKVKGNKGEDTRQILFGGSAQQVAMARMLVENCLYSQSVSHNVL